MLSELVVCILTIEFSGKSSDMEISCDIYDEKSVYETVDAFNDYCWIAVTKKDNDILNVHLEPKDSEIDVKEATYSFLNFLLGLTHRTMRETL